MKPNPPSCNNSFYGNKQSVFSGREGYHISQLLVFLDQALDFRILFKKKKQKLKTSTKAFSLQGREKTKLFCHVQNGGPRL